MKRVLLALAAVASAALVSACGTWATHSHPQASHATTRSLPETRPQAPSGSIAILDLQMTSPTNGYALSTLNPKTTLRVWQLRPMFGTSPSPAAAILRTSDGGARWTDVTPPDPFSVPQNVFDSSLYFLNAESGWLAVGVQGQGDVGTIAVAHTTDAGTHWTVSTFSSVSQDGFGGLYLNFTNRLDGWILVLSMAGAGQEEKILYATIDGGHTWQQVSCSCNISTTSLPGDSYPTGFMFNDLKGFVTALNHGDPNVWFYGSSDGGRTWQRIPLPVPSAYRTYYGSAYPPAISGLNGSMFVQFQGQNAGAVVVYRTSDGGRTWHPGSGPVVPSPRVATH